MPRADGAAWRSEASASTYRALVTRQPAEVVLEGRTPGSPVRPRLVYVRAPGRHEPFVASITLDGRRVLADELAGERGEVVLEPVPAGPHRIRVETDDPVRWYLSHARDAPPDSPSLLRRLAIHLSTDPLAFSIEKETEGRELLSGRLHAPSGTAERTRLRVEILGVDRAAGLPSPGWSFPDRRYDLAPGGGASVVLGRDGLDLDAGRPFFVPLAEDLPAGRYTLRITRLAGPPGTHLTLSALRPGLRDVRRLIREGS